MENIKPIRIVGFIAICISVLTVISLVFPANGIVLYTEKDDHDSTKVDTVKLKFPTFSSFFTIDTTHYVNIDNILNHKIDSNLLKELHSVEDSLRAFRQISMENPARIHYANDDKTVLHSFFDALEKAEDDNGSFRILHYGDSQIELDRITSYIREQLQQKFGGSGPGLQPPLQVIPNISTRQSTSGNFTRYASWGFDDSPKATHGRYGIMLNFCELDGSGGTISFTPSHQAYPLAKNINNVKILVGSLESDMTLTLRADGNKYPSKTAHAGLGVQLIEWDIDTFPEKISVSFSGGGSPEVYGIALDGQSGVSVDNMPMRGCSGTIFKKTNSTILSTSYELMNVKLLILEFGGNMMPSISSKKGAEKYGQTFYEQIMYLKEQKQDMDILVIGPADMSKRINGQMQSYPFIEDVIAALKKAAFDAGGAYWDTYQVMGGHNSMPSWVKQGLAGGDYIHFSTDGAKKISEILYEAILNDYNEYRLEKRINQINGNEATPPPVKETVKDTTHPKTKDTSVKETQAPKVLNLAKPLKKPAKKIKIKRRAQPSSNNQPDPEKTPVKDGQEIVYTVQLGDNLTKIAKKYGVSIDDIMKANEGLNPDKIAEGQVLKIKTTGETKDKEGNKGE